MCEQKQVNGSNLDPQDWFREYQNKIRSLRRSRIDDIGRNGNDGLHYDEVDSGSRVTEE